jgi:CHAT domain-containing protein/tetratricopeptide (TPR) repeat protein
MALCLAAIWASLAGILAQPATNPSVKLKGDKRLIDRFEKQNREALELSKQGDLDGALRVLNQCLATSEKALGSEDPYVGNILNNLAETKRRKGDFNSALAAAQRSFSILEKFFGPDRVEVATSLNNLAAIHLEQGDAATALSLFRRSLAIRERALGQWHPDVAVSFGNLGGAYQAAGDYARALDSARHSLGIKEKVFGRDDAETAIGLNNLAVIYAAIGAYGEALPLYQRSLEIRTKVYGPAHPKTAATMHNLGTLYSDMGDDQAASPLLAKSLDIRWQSLGAWDLTVAESFTAAGFLYMHQEQFPAALRIFGACLTIREKALGPNHPSVAAALSNCAGVYGACNQFSESLALYRRALSILEVCYGNSHPQVAVLLNNLALDHSNLGDFDTAQKLYERSLATAEATQGADHPDTIGGLRNLASLSHQMGDYSKSLALWADSFSRRQRYFALEASRLSTSRALRFGQFLLYERDGFHSLCEDAYGTNRALYALAGAHELATGKSILEEAEVAKAELGQNDGKKATVADTKVYEPEIRSESQLKPTRGDGKPWHPILAQDNRSRLASRFLDERDLAQRDIALELGPDAVLVDLLCYKRLDSSALTNRWKERRYAAYITFPLHDGATNVVVERVDLGESAPIDAAVETITRRMSAGQFTASDLSNAVQRVSELVYGPLAKHLTNVSHLIVCPDGQLSRLPFEMLRHNGKFLIEEKTISYVGSGREIVRLAGPAKLANTNAPLVLGNPDFNLVLGANPLRDEALASKAATPKTNAPLNPGLLASVPTRSLSRDYRGLKFAPLPGAEAEARGVAGLLGADTVLRLGADAREADLKQAVSPRVLHLATHGFFLSDQEFKRTNAPAGSPLPTGAFATRRLPPGEEWENPMVRCGIALAGANRTRQITNALAEDGLLTGLEASLLNLQGTELVILSACDSGTGDVKIGEGVMSLRRAFRIAGAQTVLASHWKVSDKATGLLMTEFMRRWRAGEPRAQAWREAQLSLLRSKDFSNPFFWVAFTFTGQWK